MSRFSRLELHHTESEALGVLGSDSLPSEPPDIRQWFPNYVYESPELDELDFQDSDGIGKTRVEEGNATKSANNRPIGECGDDCAGQAKPSDRIESNGCGDSECWKSVAKVSGSSESLPFSEEPPDIRNWFPNYVYESPLLDSRDFAISACEETDDGKLDIEKIAGKKIKDPLASINVDKTELCEQKDTSDAVAKGLDIVRGSKLDYESVCEDDDDDDDDDVTLQPLPSVRSLSSSDKATEPMLSGQDARYGNYKSLETIGRAKLDGKFSTRSPISSSMESNVTSHGGKPLYRPIKATDRVKHGLGNEDVNKTYETGLHEDGFISVRKRSRRENAENVARPRVEVKPMINNDKDAKIARKVLSEISNFQSRNIEGRTGKWTCPQQNKPDLGPPLKQLRLDQWVRRV